MGESWELSYSTSFRSESDDGQKVEPLNRFHLESNKRIPTLVCYC